MNCFNHAHVDAVAICARCQKALCHDCATETKDGVACKSGCAHLSPAAKAPVRQSRLRIVFGLLAVVVVLLVGLAAFQAVHENRLQAEKEAMIDSGKATAHKGADEVQAVLDRALSEGALTLSDLFDETYIPIPQSEPTKYHTRFDTYLDANIQSIEDALLENPRVVFAVAVDRNGYLPTHNAKFSLPLSGDLQKDRIGNRTKRLFNDPIGLAAATNRQAELVQTYVRDTGVQMFDIAVPIYVADRHWGAFRVGIEFK